MADKIIRIASGVKGIDTMTKGGLPAKSIIGVSGPAGIGKSIMALQFMTEGAKNNEKSVYLNLEEPRENVLKTLESFSFCRDFQAMEKKNLFSILTMNYQEFEKTYSDFYKKVERDQAIRRLVIDSFNCFFSYLKLEKHSSENSGFEIRRILSESFSLFRKRDFTTLLVMENGSNYNSELNHYIEYMVDGIIHLDFISLGSLERRIFIPKMRWTKQYDSSLPFTITPEGIAVSTKYR